jgi:hypothetical protein
MHRSKIRIIIPPASGAKPGLPRTKVSFAYADFRVTSPPVSFGPVLRAGTIDDAFLVLSRRVLSKSNYFIPVT